MIFTLYYAYATIMQWWRLRTLRNKLNGTLNDQNALLVCSGHSVHDSRKQRSLENLLYSTENRIACTVVPKQKLNLSQWIAFPKNLRYFPIFIDDNKISVSRPQIFLLLQAVLDNYVKHQSEIIQVEHFGELIGWKASDSFEVVVKTDMDHLTKLVNQFSQSDVDINHELKLLKIETVDVENTPTVIKYEKKYLKEQTLKYSYAPVHWGKFVQEVKDLYSKIRDITTPKIKIENGSPQCLESAKPIIKKEPKKTDPLSEDKNTLDVSRRHKKPREGSSSKPSKPSKHKTKSDEKQHKHKRTANKLVKQSSVKENEEVKSEVKEKVITGGTPKPPNVLVYADSLVTKDNVKRVLFSILNKEKYTIYDLPTSKNTGWDKSTVLVVVCGGVPPDLTANLIQYFLTGGQLLCICSDLMYSVLYTFTTAEVREHELVRFSYGQWQHVKMMHHIFCYQASPAKKQFSKDSDHSSNGSSPQAPRTPSNVELRHNEKDYNIQVQVLGTEETWHTPSLLLAKVKNSQGRAVFSQVHLEIDPDVYENDEDKYRELLSSNEARLEILKDIISNHLDLVCDESLGTVEYSQGYFLGRYDAKMNMMTDCDSITNNQLTCDKISVVFCGHNVEPGLASNIRLPVMIHSCPSNFSTLDYFETLNTEDIGRLVIYADILTSTQHLLDKKLRHGLVVIARQQTHGMGRSSNSWLSPLGCAAFSLQMHIPLDSHMGQSLPLIQHLVMVAVISSIKNVQGLDCLNVGIKWPNDLYAEGAIKIGGLVVTSTIFSNFAIVNIGCGVNLSNQNPTICINDLIEKNTVMQPIAYEKYFAAVFNEIERLYFDVQKNGFEAFFQLYYKYWLHR
ncbi:biotin--protein ligase isoform X2 [Tribolium castaneum]|uniref:biotin--protein ligase isoform X2 n=1 Tax=Tribolium castaneum TaxID=7070 RepID=UPI00077DA8F6|nr:PREDICTED: biotin--protein ligase isoform X2 [Tribolium castaneum]|eukprot:XP_015836200.1 PREDICTED: biotin--protein ligase isoform X2 [Tribolium castaneum]